MQVPQAGVGFLQRVLHLRREPEVLQPQQGQARPEVPDRLAQLGPLAAGPLEQDHFVFREEDEILVRI